MGAIRGVDVRASSGTRSIPIDRRFAGEGRAVVAVTSEAARAGLVATVELAKGSYGPLAVVLHDSAIPVANELEELPGGATIAEPPYDGDEPRIASHFDSGAPSVGRATLQVAVYQRQERWQLVDTDPIDVVVLGATPVGWWANHPVPLGLIELVARLGAGARDPEDALRRVVVGVQEDPGRWRYRAEGADFLADVDEDGQAMLDVMLALREPLGPSPHVAVNCKAMARFVVATAQVLGLEAHVLRMEENAAVSGQEALGTVRVLPMGDEHWLYATPQGTLAYHEVASVGGGIYDASFRLDGSGHPLFRPQGPPTATLGAGLLAFLSALVPEICADRWRPPDDGSWPKTWRHDLEVVDPARISVRGRSEEHLDFLGRIPRDVGNRVTAALAAFGAGYEAWAICTPDAARTVIFLENAKAPVRVDIRWASAPAGALGSLGGGGPVITATELGLQPTDAPLLARRLGRLLSAP